MVPADIHEFFLASAGVAGALIGLLFVAISVAGERLTRAAATSQALRIRAYAALVAFVNALTVSLFALLPGEMIGTASLVVALVGMAFVVASLMSLVRLRQLSLTTVRDGIFLVGLVVIFALQLLAGISVQDHPADAGSVRTLAILVIVCFLVGIARAWELIGGPSIGITREVVALVRGGGQDLTARPDAPAAGPPQAAQTAAGQAGDAAEAEGTAEQAGGTAPSA